MPRDFIDLTRSRGPDEPLLSCPVCGVTLNDRGGDPPSDSARHLFRVNAPFACPGCHADLRIDLRATRASGAADWTLARASQPANSPVDADRFEADALIPILQRSILETQDLTAATARAGSLLENEWELETPLTPRRIVSLVSRPRAKSVYCLPQAATGAARARRRTFPADERGDLWTSVRRWKAGLSYRGTDGQWREGARPSGLLHRETPARCGLCESEMRRSQSGRGLRLECQTRIQSEPCGLLSSRDLRRVEAALRSGLCELLQQSGCIGPLYDSATRQLPALFPEVDVSVILAGRHRSRGVFSGDGSGELDAPPRLARCLHLGQWLFDVRQILADGRPAARLRTRGLELAQWEAIRLERLSYWPSREGFIRDAQVLAEQLQRDDIAPHRVRDVLAGATFSEQDSQWTADVELSPRALALLIDPRGMSVGLSGDGWDAIRHTVLIDAPPRREQLRPEIVRLSDQGLTQRRIAQIVAASPSLVSSVLAEAPRARPRPETAAHNDSPPAEHLRARELRRQQVTHEHDLVMEFAPWTQRGDEARRKGLSEMVKNVLAGDAPRPELLPRDFSEELAAGDGVDLDLTDQTRPLSRAQFVETLFRESPATPVGRDPGVARNLGPAAASPRQLAPMGRTPGEFRGRAFTRRELDHWAREGLEHIVRPDGTEFDSLINLLEPDGLWRAALSCHFFGRPVAAVNIVGARTIRETVTVLQDYARGRVRHSCPLGGALWLRGLESVDTAITEARIYAGASPEFLSRSLGYPAEWFECYRRVFFTGPPRLIGPSGQAGAGLSTLASFKQLLFHVAQSGFERLERFLMGLAQNGHLRGTREYVVPNPLLGRAELGNYELTYQSWWLRSNADNEQYIQKCRRQLKNYEEKRSGAGRRNDDESAPQLDLALAALQKSLRGRVWPV